MGAINTTNNGALGNNTIPTTAAMAPPRIKGRRLPNLFHVLSEAEPTMGCTISPMMGATNQNRDKE